MRLNHRLPSAYRPSVDSGFNFWLLGSFPRIDGNAYLERLRLLGAGENPSHEAYADEEYYHRNAYLERLKLSKAREHRGYKTNSYERYYRRKLSKYKQLRFARLKVIGITSVTFLAVVVLLIYLPALSSVISVQPANSSANTTTVQFSPLMIGAISLAFILLFTGGVATWGYFIGKAAGMSSKFIRRADTRSHIRFYRRVGSVLLSWQERGDPIEVAKLAGVVARALFVVVQRDQWTWASPPAVADRAVRLTEPLLDIEIPDLPTRQQADTICTFIFDVIILVIAAREDLIPNARSAYSSLPRRSEEKGDTSERNILYLDPMRNRSRWDVLKDFVLPLASWLSLVISLIALFVTLAR